MARQQLRFVFDRYFGRFEKPCVAELGICENLQQRWTGADCAHICPQIFAHNRCGYHEMYPLFYAERCALQLMQMLAEELWSGKHIFWPAVSAPRVTLSPFRKERHSELANSGAETDGQFLYVVIGDAEMPEPTVAPLGAGHMF